MGAEIPMSLIPEILDCDEALLVVNKPAGLLSIADGYDPLKPHLRTNLEPQYGRLWIVHRLDKDTSGVIILARTAAAHRTLNIQFSQNQVEKSYLAIVSGVPTWDEKIVDLPLRSGTGRRKRTRVDEQRGKAAITVYRLLARFPTHALVEARPKTGRTHQIRVHLYSLGYPVLSDPLYGEGIPSEHIQRQALHAQSVSIQHPLAGRRVTYTAPIPGDMAAALEALSPDC
jgi:tRNA pseudouridine32 synthase/23S rRNA pseudouridine746 synthase